MKICPYVVIFLSVCGLLQANELSSGTLIQLSSIGSIVVLTSAYTILKEYRRRNRDQ